MNLIKKINYDDEGIYDVSYFSNGREISFEDYIKIENALEEDFEDDYEECDGDCEHCDLNEENNKSRHPYDVIADEINEIIEMVDNDACYDCLGEKLMDFFMTGVDMGLQGVFARKE